MRCIGAFVDMHGWLDPGIKEVSEGSEILRKSSDFIYTEKGKYKTYLNGC
jgi:hypothetical protein